MKSESVFVPTDAARYCEVVNPDALPLKYKCIVPLVVAVAVAKVCIHVAPGRFDASRTKDKAPSPN
jgi:hypothetical protein